MKLEFEMRLPVSRWLLSRGLSPICEVQSLGNCDLVGVRFEEKPVRLVEMVAVELKLRDVAGVLSQCSNHKHRSITEVWAALPPEVAVRHRKRFADAGIGLLAVTTSGAEPVVTAVRSDECLSLSRWCQTLRRRRNEYQWRMNNQNMLRLDGAPIAGTGCPARQGGSL